MTPGGLRRACLTAVLALLVERGLAADNAVGLTPPQGWRSWNAFSWVVTQQEMVNMMHRMTERKRLVDGVPTSLLDLGYNYIGLDDGYQACGQGVNGSFYTSDGDPIINTTKFPNLTEMVANAHGMGLKVGWYLNNCICNPFKAPSELSPEFAMQVLHGTVRALREASFDAVKLDSCGPNMNATAWYDEINRTGADPVLIDLCHTGHDGPGSSICRGTAMPSECPYNMFASAQMDIRPTFESILAHLNSTLPFMGDNSLSRPGAWANPVRAARRPLPACCCYSWQ